MKRLNARVSAARSLRIGRAFDEDDSRAVERCRSAKPNTDSPTHQPNGGSTGTAAHVNNWSANSPPSPTAYVEGGT